MTHELQITMSCYKVRTQTNITLKAKEEKLFPNDS